jgi:hypothetical protein
MEVNFNLPSQKFILHMNLKRTPFIINCYNLKIWNEETMYYNPKFPVLDLSYKMIPIVLNTCLFCIKIPELYTGTDILNNIFMVYFCPRDCTH